MFIKLNRTDLVTGYRRAGKARWYLLSRWRFELLRAYTQQRDRYFHELARRQARKDLYRKRTLPWIGAGLIVLFFLGIWLALDRNSCFGSLLMLAAILGWMLAMASFVAYPTLPARPLDPLGQASGKHISPVKQKLFPDLVPAWREGLRARIPSSIEVQEMAAQLDERGKQQWGLIGEFRVVRAMARIAPPGTLILHSLKPKPGDDMDVVVIGPKGFWYFEVKHWNAEFYWRNGAWDVYQFDRDQGIMVRAERTEYPDAQWRRTGQVALSNIHQNARGLVESVPAFRRIRGGIVFTNPNARFYIQSPATFNWGTLLHWVRYFQNLPIHREVTFDHTLQLAEVLLRRHQSIHTGLQLYSMNEQVHKVITEAEKRLEGWIASET